MGDGDDRRTADPAAVPRRAREDGTGHHQLLHEWNEVWVRCPRCDARALVREERPRKLVGDGRTLAVGVCASCAWTARSDVAWLGSWRGTATWSCGGCGRRHRVTRTAARNDLEWSFLRCNGCGHETRAGWKWWPQAAPASDPWLGLPLWLVTDVDGHRLWAWNAEHLRLIRDWIAADLREGPVDVRRRSSKSVVATLPRWMTRASRRARVLAAIDELAAR